MFYSKRAICQIAAYCTILCSQSACADSPLDDPALVVDLGYALYRPSIVNETTGYVSYNNLRYAAPPVEALRFEPPAPPENVRSQGPITGPKVNLICPQANPDWVAPAVNALGDDAKYTIPPGVAPLTNSEDCLFLDVRTPRKRGPKLRPVLVFIHGGGYVVGVKGKYDPTSLLAESKNDIIYVVFQYRIGAFGWLTDVDNNGITPNLGLLDQRAALKWVQDHIKSFGGDPTQVTIMGESAGGGSVLLHSTAYGGSKETTLFRRGIPQSPFVTNITEQQQRDTTKKFLNELGVGTIAGAKALSYEKLAAANKKVIAPSPYGTFTFGPTIDGDLVQELPGRLFIDGRYNKNLDIMPAYNADEARLFTDQTANSEDDYADYLRTTYPEASSSKIAFVQKKLYPAKYDGSLPYRTPVGRLGLTIQESLLSCQCYGADRAYLNRAYEYIFAVPPAYHFQDILYTLTAPGPLAIPSIASGLQRYIAQFVKQGNPNNQPLPNFPSFKTGKSLILTGRGFFEVDARNAAAERRCQFWLSGEIFQ